MFAKYALILTNCVEYQIKELCADLDKKNNRDYLFRFQSEEWCASLLLPNSAPVKQKLVLRVERLLGMNECVCGRLFL